MKLETINVEETIEATRKMLDEDPGVSPALKTNRTFVGTGNVIGKSSGPQ